MALSQDSLRLLLYEFASRRWTPLLDAGTALSYPSWAWDSRSVFVDEGEARVRVWIADRREETVISYADMRRFSPFGVWVNHAPGDSLLTERDTSINEMFALELESP